jgi:hypothetical protein
LGQGGRLSAYGTGFDTQHLALPSCVTQPSVSPSPPRLFSQAGGKVAPGQEPRQPGRGGREVQGGGRGVRRPQRQAEEGDLRHLRGRWALLPGLARCRVACGVCRVLLSRVSPAPRQPSLNYSLAAAHSPTHQHTETSPQPTARGPEGRRPAPRRRGGLWRRRDAGGRLPGGGLSLLGRRP